jgi:hypothetical protein
LRIIYKIILKRVFKHLVVRLFLSFVCREYCEQFGLIKLLGEYRARCLFSKNWNLRDAMLRKMSFMLENEFRNELNAAIPVACAVTKVGVEDKMQQVVFSGVDLLEHVLQTAKR